MPIISPQAMRPVLIMLKVLIVLNLAGLALFALILAGSFTGFVATTLADDYGGAAVERMLLGVRLGMLIGMLIVPFAHFLLTRLKSIVETVRAGDPFVAVNARRLKIIAWCLLAIQVLDLGFGAVSITAGPPMEWSFAVTGWIAVVLLFVLAKVFEHGTAMRDELAGTV